MAACTSLRRGINVAVEGELHVTAALPNDSRKSSWPTANLTKLSFERGVTEDAILPDSRRIFAR